MRTLDPTVYLVVRSDSGYVAEVFDTPRAASVCRDLLGSGWHVITRVRRLSVPAEYHSLPACRREAEAAVRT